MCDWFVTASCCSESLLGRREMGGLERLRERLYEYVEYVEEGDRGRWCRDG